VIAPPLASQRSTPKLVAWIPPPTSRVIRVAVSPPYLVPAASTATSVVVVSCSRQRLSENNSGSAGSLAMKAAQRSKGGRPLWATTSHSWAAGAAPADSSAVRRAETVSLGRRVKERW
jgi:hypothetical protein